jgi:hypothetical protein
MSYYILKDLEEDERRYTCTMRRVKFKTKEMEKQWLEKQGYNTSDHYKNEELEQSTTTTTTTTTKWQVLNIDNETVLEEFADKNKAFEMLAWYDMTEPGVNHGVYEKQEGG